MAKLTSVVWGDNFSGVGVAVTPATAGADGELQCSERCLLIAINSDTATTQTGSVVSQANRHGRTEDIAISLTASQLAGVNVKAEGWQTLGGKVHVVSGNAAVLWLSVNVRD